MLKTYLLFIQNTGAAELHFQNQICDTVVDQEEQWESIAQIAKRLLKRGEEVMKMELLSERWRQPNTKTYRLSTYSVGEERPVTHEEAVVAGH